MSFLDLSSLSGVAKNFARFILFIIIIAIFSQIIISGKDFLISKNFLKQNINEREIFIDNLSFDYKIVDVVDGDTIKVKRLDGEKIDGKDKVTLRLIGINTPETVDPRRPVECFGKEASKYMKTLADGKVAALEFDPSQGIYDKYNRLLAFVFIKESGVYPNNVLFLNEKMIKDGYAFEYTYNIPHKYQMEFKALERDARNYEIGLWAPNTCSGLKTPVSSPPEE